MNEAHDNSCKTDAIEPQRIKKLLDFIYDFIYEARLPQDFEDAVVVKDLYVAADYYGLERLKKICG